MMTTSIADHVIADAISEVEALVPARAAAFAGLTNLLEAYKSILADNIEMMATSLRAFAAIRNPMDLFEFQQQLVRNGVASAIRDGGKIAGTSATILTSIMSPLQTRPLLIFGSLHPVEFA